MIYKIDNTYITFSIKGNFLDENENYYSTDVLYNAYKDSIGKEIELHCEGTVINKQKRIISSVSIQGEYIFVDTILKEESGM